MESKEGEDMVTGGFVVRQMGRWKVSVRPKVVLSRKERGRGNLDGLVIGYMDSRLGG